MSESREERERSPREHSPRDRGRRGMQDEQWGEDEEQGQRRRSFGSGYDADRERENDRGYGAMRGRDAGSWQQGEGANGPGWPGGRDERDRWAERGAQSFGRGRDRAEREHGQADGFSAMESEDQRWSRRQGLYGASEYAGFLSGPGGSQRNLAGKGPKGWQRSDERIKEDVSEALARDPDIDASDIEVQVNQCEITLSGTVDDRRMKRLAEDCVERVFGVVDVQNQIRVRRDGDRKESGAGNERSNKASEREVARMLEQEGRADSGESKHKGKGTQNPSTGTTTTG
jgi:BON domain